MSREAATGVHLQPQPQARLAPQQGIGLFCPLLSSVTYGPSAFSLHTPCPHPSACFWPRQQAESSHRLGYGLSAIPGWLADLPGCCSWSWEVLLPTRGQPPLPTSVGGPGGPPPQLLARAQLHGVFSPSPSLCSPGHGSCQTGQWHMAWAVALVSCGLCRATL